MNVITLRPYQGGFSTPRLTQKKSANLEITQPVHVGRSDLTAVGATPTDTATTALGYGILGLAGYGLLKLTGSLILTAVVVGGVLYYFYRFEQKKVATP